MRRERAFRAFTGVRRQKKMLAKKSKNKLHSGASPMARLPKVHDRFFAIADDDGNDDSGRAGAADPESPGQQDDEPSHLSEVGSKLSPLTPPPRPAFSTKSSSSAIVSANTLSFDTPPPPPPPQLFQIDTRDIVATAVAYQVSRGLNSQTTANVFAQELSTRIDVQDIIEGLLFQLLEDRRRRRRRWRWPLLCGGVMAMV